MLWDVNNISIKHIKCFGTSTFGNAIGITKNIFKNTTNTLICLNCTDIPSYPKFILLTE